MIRMDTQHGTFDQVAPASEKAAGHQPALNDFRARRRLVATIDSDHAAGIGIGISMSVNKSLSISASVG